MGRLRARYNQAHALPARHHREGRASGRRSDRQPVVPSQVHSLGRLGLHDHGGDRNRARGGRLTQNGRPAGRLPSWCAGQASSSRSSSGSETGTSHTAKLPSRLRRDSGTRLSLTAPCAAFIHLSRSSSKASRQDNSAASGTPASTIISLKTGPLLVEQISEFEIFPVDRYGMICRPSASIVCRFIALAPCLCRSGGGHRLELIRDVPQRGEVALSANPKRKADRAHRGGRKGS
jgi:hypothetical protein